MKIYIAGRITGDKNYKEKFDNAEKMLKEQGHIIMNPSILPLGFNYEDYMTIGFEMLNACDAIYMIPGWFCSGGAKREWLHAKETHKIIMYDIKK